jgi:arginyl-tRNA synthetase
MKQLKEAALDVLLEALGQLEGIDALPASARAELVPAREELAQAFSRPPSADKGDLAFPCFPLAKLLKTAPPKIAGELQDKIVCGGLIARVEALGPYLNFFADPRGLLADLCSSLADGSFDASVEAEKSAKVMIEYSQPNTHKVFHVGHLRNVAVGDCLVRVLRARGHSVVAANYYGDFGIDVAKCLWWLQNKVDEAAPEVGRGAWLGAAYVACNTHIKELEAAEKKDEVQALFVQLREVLDDIKAGRAPYAQLYADTRQWCLDEFAEVYNWLDATFDHDFFESQVEEEGQAIVDEYLEKGIFEPSQGATICNLDEFKLGPALVRKSDGTSLYLTWDLALARTKFRDFEIERSLYVVGSEQSYHFQQLFATLQRMGYDRASDCRHVAYELVMHAGPNGLEKMSSRAGTSIPLHRIQTEVCGAIEAKMRSDERTDRAEWTEQQWQETVQRLAVACLRYGMLSMGNTTRIGFDMDAWTSFEGESGAYLQYGLARISGIFKKSERPDLATAAGNLSSAEAFGGDAERTLLNHLLRYGEILATVERDLDPSNLAHYVFEGTKLFSRFYHDCPVLKAEEPLRSSRLALVAATEAVLGRAVGCLGIQPVSGM